MQDEDRDTTPGEASLSRLNRRKFLGAAAAVTGSSLATGTAAAAGPTNGIYRITPVHSGKAVDVDGVSEDNGANIHQWGYVGGENQHWMITDHDGDGVYHVQAFHSGKALDVENLSTSNGGNVHQWTDQSGSNQLWEIIDNGDGTYRFINANSGKALEVEGGDTSDGANVQQWDYAGYDHQKFTLERVERLDNNDWQLDWSDEFNDGSLDTSIWTQAEANGCDYHSHMADCGWGNNELEYYTTDESNVSVDDRNLTIEARREEASCEHGTFDYTSARLHTQDAIEKQYGRIDFRAKLPGGMGLWPALWMLGHDIADPSDWPGCGEIDVMEQTDNETDTVHQTIHGPGYSGGDGITASYTGPDFTSSFNDFQVTWYQDVVKFWVNGNHVNTITADDVSPDEWVFNKPFFLLMNIAVGGDLAGDPSDTSFPRQMQVKHVRVYDWV